MNKPSSRIVFRTDASPDIGGGHVMRCLSLAEAIAERGWSVSFATSPLTVETLPALLQKPYEVLVVEGDETHFCAKVGEKYPLGIDVVVSDSYAISVEQEQLWRPVSRSIAVIDDLANRQHECDVLLDQNLGRMRESYTGLVPQLCKVLTGPHFALLRPEFASARGVALGTRSARSTFTRLLISLGLTDGAGATLRVLDAIAAADYSLHVDVLIGGACPHLTAINIKAKTLPRPATVHVDISDPLPLLIAADACIGGGGSSAWERCCIGLPTLTVIVADNQRFGTSHLVQAGAAYDLGSLEKLSDNSLAKALDTISDQKVRANMSLKAANICDGLGAQRVADILVAL